MDDLLNFLNDYGNFIYAFLFAYCLLKSGSLPLVGGYAAQVGVLDWPFVFAAAFFGGYVGDELRFFVARRYGSKFISSRPWLKVKIDVAMKLLDRYGSAYTFIYRYPKGMRTIGALPIGLTQTPWKRFTLLNCASALLWSTIMVGAGYFLGATIESYVQEGWGAFSVFLLLVMIFAIAVLWRRAVRVPSKMD